MKCFYRLLLLFLAVVCINGHIHAGGITWSVSNNLNNNKSDLIAFPGAEGFGKYTTGGRSIDSRGSKVYYVTSLADDGSVGTLRWALVTGDDTPRTILFNTCGTIYLKSKLSFTHPNITIEGQTAPGGGICIAGNRFYVCKNNIILRYLRFRAGDIENKSYPAIDVENIKHCIIDHCSFSWSMEENMTMYDNDSTTVQWCITSEGLYNSKNVKGARSYAAQWGGQHSTYHHNLISNCNNRAPRVNGVRDGGHRVGAHDEFVNQELINNVIFNWGKPNSCYGGENYAPYISGAFDHIYMINNYYKPGPATYNKVRSNRYFAQASKYKAGNGYTGQWFLSGNVMEVSGKGDFLWQNRVLNKVNKDNFYGAATGDEDRAFNIEEGNNAENFAKYTLHNQDVSSGVTTQSAYVAYPKVVAADGTGAGAQLPHLDEVDSRVLNEAAGKILPVFYGGITKDREMLGIIDSQKDVKLAKDDPNVAGWPYLGLEGNQTLIVDTDKDGISDDYEDTHGLNKNDSTDATDIASNGYSNLENYLNAVADGSYVPSYWQK